MNYARFITKLSSRRQPSIIRELNRPFPPDFVLFTAGKPNPALFPFTKATFETDDGKKLVFEGAVMKEALQYQNSLVNSSLLHTVSVQLLYVVQSCITFCVFI